MRMDEVENTKEKCKKGCKTVCLLLLVDNDKGNQRKMVRVVVEGPLRRRLLISRREREKTRFFRR